MQYVVGIERQSLINIDLGVFENRVLRKIFGPNREEAGLNGRVV